MADLSTGQSPVTTTAAVIVPYDLAGSDVIIRNTGATTVYIGGPGVTPSTGYPLMASDAPLQPLPVNDAIWGVTASGSSTIAWVESNR
jgi:hypothetical protein